MGDVARTVPALVSLKRAYPDAQIDWFVHHAFVDVIRHHPDLHAVVPFYRSQTWRAVRQWFSMLVRREYDAAYDLQGLTRSGLFTLATGARHRIGAAGTRELARIGYNVRHAVPPGLHTVDEMLAILQADGIAPVHDMRLYVGPAEREWAAQWWAEHDLQGKRVAMLAPTAKWLIKRWPIERFATVTDRLAEKGFDAAVVLGAENERNQVAGLFGKPDNPLRRIDMVGRTSIGRMMALIERGDLLIANDSAALHLAVGLGRRCVGIFGPTDPAHDGPYRYDRGVARPQDHSAVNYSRRSADCGPIRAVDVEAVWRTIECVLDAPPPEPNTPN